MEDLFRDDEFDKDKVPDQWHYFEVMDRTHILLAHITEALYNHPGLDEENSAKVSKAADLLSEVYQWAGQKSFKDE
jgi:hypothetical protein